MKTFTASIILCLSISLPFISRAEDFVSDEILANETAGTFNYQSLSLIHQGMQKWLVIKTLGSRGRELRSTDRESIRIWEDGSHAVAILFLDNQVTQVKASLLFDSARIE